MIFLLPQLYFKYFLEKVHIKVSSVNAWSNLSLNQLVRRHTEKREMIAVFETAESSLANTGQRARLL